MRVGLPAAVVLLVFGCLPCLQADTHVAVFKDGFLLSGRVKQPTGFIVDKISGQSFSVPLPGALFSLEDTARIVLFSPNQLQDAVKGEDEKSDHVRIALTPPLGSGPLPARWTLESTEPWNRFWERTVRINWWKGKQVLENSIDQRLTLLTPTFVRVDAHRFDWTQYHLTSELEPETVRKLLLDYYDRRRKDLKMSEVQWRVQMAKFFMQAGWLHQAEQELADIQGDSDLVDPVKAQIKLHRNREFLTDLELAAKHGRYEEMQHLLQRFVEQEMGRQMSEKQVLAVQDLKNKLEAGKEKLEKARLYLKELPEKTSSPHRSFFKIASAALLEELHPDNLDRLETFLDQAQDHEQALRQKRKPSQTADQLLSFAISGWLLGNGAAEDNLTTARQLWQARQMILAYLKTEDEDVRQRLLNSLRSKDAPSVDVLARLIRQLPPPEPFDKLDNEVLDLEVKGSGLSYHVQLPPEYHPGRSWPVLMVLHYSGQKPLAMLRHWSELAKKHGYLLVAPRWGKGLASNYGYTAREHQVVLDCLRDLRRRFNIDNDRVFLFGAGDGGQMALDVGLSHPDQFAGVLPMTANPNYFPMRYWPNAQFLPLYVVDGQRNGKNSEQYHKLFKEWVRWHYPAIYVEYKGRSNEWFGGELPRMIDWMNRKKRYHPTRQLGVVNNAGGKGEEFQTMRTCDNRFYWIGTEAILDRCLNSASFWNPQITPATLHATIFTGNQIHIRTTGVKQVSVWLAPGMINFAEKVSIRLNGNVVGTPRLLQPSVEVLLDDFLRHGDRQRLYLARLDFKL